MAEDYATTQELRERLGMSHDLQEEPELALSLTSASRAIDDWTGQRFWADATVVARIFDGTKGRTIETGPIAYSAGVVVETDDNDDATFETTWAATDYTLVPLNAPADEEPWTGIRRAKAGTRTWPTAADSVRITARYGWASVPSRVKEATLLQAARWILRKDTPYGWVDMANTESAVKLAQALDADVQVMLSPYRPMLVR